MPFSRETRSLPLSHVTLTDPFWSTWQSRVAEVTLPAAYLQIKQTNRLENFRRVAEGATGGFEGIYFNDSDVYKWLEAVAYALLRYPNAELQAMADEAITLIAAAQAPDGYLNTFFQLDHPALRWRNLGAMHEMYCGGHLVEAAVAWKENLGNDRLLRVAEAFVACVRQEFGPDCRVGYCGHEEFELALCRLADCTGKAEYREFARWMVDVRGQTPGPFEAELNDAEAQALSPWHSALRRADGSYSGEYAQDHAPVREHTEVVGHAVRAMYLYIAATMLSRDPAMEEALQRIWTNLTDRRMYITGGIGASARNEGFTVDFDLPNLTAYAETCASVGLALWGMVLGHATGESAYFDVVERALYNGALAGISEDGLHFFYDNPLESRGTHRRTEWFGCACCPPNIARLIGRVTDLLVSVGDAQFNIHIPAPLSATFEVRGITVQVEISGPYPHPGVISIQVTPERPVQFALRIRMPEWADEIEIELPEAKEGAGYDRGYAVYDRTWSGAETVTVDLGMEPYWTTCDPRVLDNVGRVALLLGPLVYCAESNGADDAPQRFAAFVAEGPAEAHGSLSVEGERLLADFPEGLYAPLDSVEHRSTRQAFVPYYKWNNAGPSYMQVWIREPTA